MTIPSVVCSISRATWITLLAVFWFASHQEKAQCSADVYRFTKLASVVYTITFLTYFSMLVVSCRGTVLEHEKRWCMPGLFQFLIFIIACEGAMAVYGTLISIDSETECSTDPNVHFSVMKFVVAMSWVDLIFSTCCGCITLSMSTRDEQQEMLPVQPKKRAGKRAWYCWGEEEQVQAETHATSSSSSPLLEGGGTRTTPSNSQLFDESAEEQDEYAFSLEEERQTDADQAFLLGTFPSLLQLDGEDDAAAAAAAGAGNEYAVNDKKQTREDAELSRTVQTWRLRLRAIWALVGCLTCGLLGDCCTCCKGEDAEPNRVDAFQEFAIVLAGWFKNLELVPSDIMAALFLMRAEQREMEKLAVREIQIQQNNNFHGNPTRRARRGTLTSVGRWMWTTNGPASRANHILHAQQIRASRDARVSRAESVLSQDTSFDEESLNNTNTGGEEDFVDPEAKALLEHALEMSPYMVGMYGWFWFSYMSGWRAWLALCCGSRFCCSCRARSKHRYRGKSAWEEGDGDEDDTQLAAGLFDARHAEQNLALETSGDGCCNWNTRALVERVAMGTAARAIVVYATFTTVVGQRMPYSVCVDHSQRRVVLAVRGTLTLADALTHGSMVPAPLGPLAKRWGFSDEIDVDSHCHAGILKIAHWLRQDLEKRDVLHKLFGISNDAMTSGEEEEEEATGVGAGNRKTFSIPQSDFPDCRGYSLELTGHSLGAGVAVVLSLFLRPAFPNVRCTAFAPPGSVFDLKLSNHCSAWVSSVFLGEDFVPRLSWHALFKLRAQILDTLRRDKTNKFWAVFSSWYGGRPIDQLLYKTDEVPDSEHTRKMQKKIDDLATARKTSLLDSVRLYAPGKLLHLMKDETVSNTWWCCRWRHPAATRAHYVPMWVDDRTTLDEILLSPRMAFDHFPDIFEGVLQQVIQEYCALPKPYSASTAGLYSPL